jgi:hypothetical protein
MADYTSFMQRRRRAIARPMSPVHLYQRYLHNIRRFLQAAKGSVYPSLDVY